MLTIVQISDLHFGPPFVERVGEVLLQIVPELAPDAIVISGDLTQRAKAGQFAAAKAFLGQLPPVPQLVIPGNHDVPLYRVFERLFDPHRLYREYISEDLDQVLRLDGAIVVGLDSTAPRRAISNGRLHAGQLDFCSETFAGADPGAARIVVAHHHFAPAPDYMRDQTMPKAKRAMGRFVELGVELIMGGHLHRAYVGNSLDFFPGNDRDRGIIIVQSGTTTSRRGRGRERERNSFNRIEITADTICVTHYMYFEQAHRFAGFSRHLFPRFGDSLREMTV